MVMMSKRNAKPICGSVGKTKKPSPLDTNASFVMKSKTSMGILPKTSMTNSGTSRRSKMSI